MSKNKKLDTDNRDNYDDDALTDAVIGQVVKEDGYKLSLSKINRYLKSFGLPTIKRDDLQHHLTVLEAQKDTVSTHPMGYYLYSKVKNNKLSLHDLFGEGQDEEHFDNYLKHRISPQVISDLDVKKDQREFKALLKDGSFVQEAIEKTNQDLLSHMKDYEFASTKVPKIQNPNSETSLLVNAADWHLGNVFSVNLPGLNNHYDYEVFKDRWYKFLDYTLKLAQENHVKKIYMIHLGDIIEGVYMRPNQGFYTEFDFNTQIRIATKEMINSLQILAKAGYEVITGMIIGNHDRIFTKKDNLYGDGATALILNSIKLIKDLDQLPNVTVLDNSSDIHDLNIEIEDKNVLFTHGEKIKKAQNNNIANLTGKRKPLDLLIYGHYHDFQVKSGNGGTMEICVPALKGWDTYSKGLATNASAPGQLAMLFEPYEAPEILPYLFN